MPAAATHGPTVEPRWTVRSTASTATSTARAAGQNWRAKVHHWVDHRVSGVTAKKVRTGTRSHRPGRIAHSTCHRTTRLAVWRAMTTAAAGGQPSGARSATPWAITTDPGENPAVTTVSVGEVVGRVTRKSFWLNQPRPTMLGPPDRARCHDDRRHRPW